MRLFVINLCTFLNPNLEPLNAIPSTLGVAKLMNTHDNETSYQAVVTKGT